MAEILEVLMVVSFGFAWPTSIANSLRARTAKGKSPYFLAIIIFGYIWNSFQVYSRQNQLCSHLLCY